MTDDQRAFLGELEDTVRECIKIGYRPKKFMSMVASSDPFEVVRSLVNAREMSDGFIRLQQEKRLDLSCEAIVLKPKWRSFFTPQDIQNARRRLHDVGYRASWDDGEVLPPSKGTASSAAPFWVKPRSVSEAPTVPHVLPPIPDAQAFLTRIRGLQGQLERNHEDAVRELLLKLGFNISEVEFQKNRIDVCILGQEKTVKAVFEVKRTIALESEQRQARRQGFDYANESGARWIVLSDGDRYEIYDRDGGRDFKAMLKGQFRLTDFHESDKVLLDLLRPENLRS